MILNLSISIRKRYHNHATFCMANVVKVNCIIYFSDQTMGHAGISPDRMDLHNLGPVSTIAAKFINPSKLKVLSSISNHQSLHIAFLVLLIVLSYLSMAFNTMLPSE